MRVELHFQDGFRGETVEVLVDGETVEVLVEGEARTSFQARTRYQINLAEVIELDLEPGQQVQIRLTPGEEHIDLPTQELHRYYVISRDLEKVSAEPTDEMPRYM